MNSQPPPHANNNNNNNIDYQQIEERINEWLDNEQIQIVNPQEKIDDYFSLRKRQLSNTTNSDKDSIMNKESDSNPSGSCVSISIHSERIEEEGSQEDIIQNSRKQIRRGSAQLQMIQSKLIKRRLSINNFNSGISPGFALCLN